MRCTIVTKTYLHFDEKTETSYLDYKDYSGIEFFVKEGTRPTWEELREICGDGKVVGLEFCDDADVSPLSMCNSDCSGNVSGWSCTGCHRQKIVEFRTKQPCAIRFEQLFANTVKSSVGG